jgi:hypothetical protein
MGKMALSADNRSPTNSPKKMHNLVSKVLRGKERFWGRGGVLSISDTRGWTEPLGEVMGIALGGRGWR